MNITIDTKSGCCPGVRKALEEAERLLDNKGELYCLGSIVHNNTEIARLEAKGLKIIGYPGFNRLHDATVLIRAHGEPPSTYRTARENHLNLIDCTCPVVLKLQQKIAQQYRILRPVNGQIVLFGKKGHAEVNGLVGQVDSDVLIVEKLEDIDRSLREGRLDTARRTAIFSQTTKDPDEYRRICDYLSTKVEQLEIHNTICTLVASRHEHLVHFASDHSLIFFVSGKDSSNGRLLYELCRSINPNTHLVSSLEEVDLSLVHKDENIGICGATSTPKWQLEAINDYLSKFMITFAEQKLRIKQ